MKHRKPKSILKSVYRCEACNAKIEVITNVNDKPHHAGFRPQPISTNQCLWCKQRRIIDNCACRGCQGSTVLEALGGPSIEQIVQSAKVIDLGHNPRPVILDASGQPLRVGAAVVPIPPALDSPAQRSDPTTSETPSRDPGSTPPETQE